MKLKYHVERQWEENKWIKVPFTDYQTLAYCIGYVDAMDSLYPSPPYRIVETGTGKVVRETKGRASVTTN